MDIFETRIILIMLFILAICYPLAATALLAIPELVHEWTTMELEWPSDELKFNYTKDGMYIPNNNALAGIKVYKQEIYVTIPRWR